MKKEYIHILDLPKDIINNILSFVNNVTDIFHFCHLCKQLQPLFLPRLKNRLKEISPSLFKNNDDEKSNVYLADFGLIYIYFKLKNLYIEIEIDPLPTSSSLDFVSEITFANFESHVSWTSCHFQIIEFPDDDLCFPDSDSNEDVYEKISQEPCDAGLRGWLDKGLEFKPNGSKNLFTKVMSLITNTYFLWLILEKSISPLEISKYKRHDSIDDTHFKSFIEKITSAIQ